MLRGTDNRLPRPYGGATEECRNSAQRDEPAEHPTLARRECGKRAPARVGSHHGARCLRRSLLCHPARYGQEIQLHAREWREDTEPGRQEPLCASEYLPIRHDGPSGGFKVAHRRYGG